jgi:hypothetical protein
MTTSEQIRSLAREGLSTAEIARRLGIRYQHVYGVLHSSGTSAARNNTNHTTPSKPSLMAAELLAGGFTLSACWVLSAAGQLVLNRASTEGWRCLCVRKNRDRALRRSGNHRPREEALLLWANPALGR